MYIPAIRRVPSGKPGVIAFEIPSEFGTALSFLCKYQEVKKKRGAAPFYSLRLDVPFRPRTTGEHSQNTHFNGHVRQISAETGQPFEDVKKRVKQMALEFDYPALREDDGSYILDLWGMPQGISESDASVEDAKLLIDAVHMLADFLEIKLIEE